MRCRTRMCSSRSRGRAGSRPFRQDDVIPSRDVSAVVVLAHERPTHEPLHPRPQRRFDTVGHGLFKKGLTQLAETSDCLRGQSAALRILFQSSHCGLKRSDPSLRTFRRSRSRPSHDVPKLSMGSRLQDHRVFHGRTRCRSIRRASVIASRAGTPRTPDSISSSDS